jgi:hypothetical protein
VEFASLLKQSKYTGGMSWSEVQALANSSFNPNDAIQTEFLGIIEKSKKIYGKIRKRKRTE